MPTLSDAERTRRVAIVCCAFTRNVAYYRTGHAIAVRNGNFWRTADGNFLDIAVLEWCKLFAEPRGAHHWKKVIPAQEHTSFFTAMLADAGISEDQFNAYILTLRTYRDKFIAHLDEENTMNIPVLNFATETVRFLCNHLRTTHPEWFNGGLPEMRTYYQECCNEAQVVFGRLGNQI